jgi:hypothetical protein
MPNQVVRYEPPPAGFRNTAKNLRSMQGFFGYLMDMMGAMANKCDELAEENGEPIQIESYKKLDSNGRPEATATAISQEVQKAPKAAS